MVTTEKEGKQKMWMRHMEHKIQEVTLDRVESILLGWLLLDYFIKTHRRLRKTTDSNLLCDFCNI